MLHNETVNIGRMVPRLLLAASLAALLCALPGCVTVQPWERATLSHPCMDLAPGLGDGYRGHILPIREGALAGGAGIGGGCGCN